MDVDASGLGKSKFLTKFIIEVNDHIQKKEQSKTPRLESIIPIKPVSMTEEESALLKNKGYIG